MSHADAVVLAVRDELRASGFMVSTCLLIEDDPAGDFGIAWTFGVDRTTGCERMAFDVGYLPSRHTIVHEFGHDLHARWQYAGIFDAFWRAAFYDSGVLITPDESARLANAQSDPYQAWRRRPTEIIADFFAWTVLGDWIQTETYGVPLTAALRARLAAVFRSFSEEVTTVTPEQIQELKTFIANEVAAAEARLRQRVAQGEVDLIRELLGGMKAGFNVTLPTMLNRLARGDKDVLTEPIDNGV